MFKQQNLRYLFLALILIDVGYTFIQNTNTMFLDGDMPAIIVPDKNYDKVLSDPFGLSVFTDGEMYPATNRFFIHFSMQKYFQTIPFLIQKFTDPITSIFLSIALARTLMHLLILYLIAVMISGSFSLINKNFVLVAVLITPLFQVNGYSSTMGITTNSITYTFFYTTPFIFILCYMIPFVMHFYHGKPFIKSRFLNLLLALLLVPVAFGGPLGPPVVLVLVLSVVVFAVFYRSSNLSDESESGNKIQLIDGVSSVIVIHIAFALVLCLYSFYLGTFNSENLWVEKGFCERYQLLLIGIGKIFTKKIGLPILAAVCILNLILIYRMQIPNLNSVKKFLFIPVIFIICYLLLLPWGGYREYRPYILRSDTFSPVTISLIIIYAISFLKLIDNFKGRNKNALIMLTVILSLIYTNADRFEPDLNECQKDYLKYLSNSPDNVVQLHGECTLLQWERLKDPARSELAAEIICYWNITEEKRLFYFADGD